MIEASCGLKLIAQQNKAVTGLKSYGTHVDISKTISWLSQIILRSKENHT
jgi:hypothetical protein